MAHDFDGDQPSTPGFDEWYRTHWTGLVAAVTAMTRDQDVAADVCAEAVSRAWTRWDRLDDPGAWAYRVAVNLAKRRARRAAMEATLLRRHPPALTIDPAEPAGPVWTVVAGLPHQQRTVIALRYLADLTQPQVAAVLGISTGTVASTLHDARRRLAETLGRDPLDLDTPVVAPGPVATEHLRPLHRSARPTTHSRRIAATPRPSATETPLR